MKYILSLALPLLFFTASAWAGEDWTKIKTPRGSEMEVLVHSPKISIGSAIVVAPGQSCNSKGPLFQTIGNRGSEAGFTVIRFEWSYCARDTNLQNPSADLKNEAEDFMTALNNQSLYLLSMQTKFLLQASLWGA